jgi:hypothetical protein
MILLSKKRVMAMSTDDYDDLTEDKLDEILELADTLKFDASLIESEKCTACNGSGRYDHNGSPKCGSCHGRGLAPFSEKAIRSLSKNLSKLDRLDWREARSVSKIIQDHMKSIGLGWEDEHYWG